MKKRSLRTWRRRIRILWTLPVRAYRKWISPLKPPCCRFTPSCSAYALEAVMKRGIFVGTALAIWRLLRCNPFGGSGYDPVPEKREKTRCPSAGNSLRMANDPRQADSAGPQED